MPACLLVLIFAYRHTCLPTDIPACLPACLPARPVIPAGLQKEKSFNRKQELQSELSRIETQLRSDKAARRSKEIEEKWKVSGRAAAAVKVAA
jgi:hypothetical protein